MKFHSQADTITNSSDVSYVGLKEEFAKKAVEDFLLQMKIPTDNLRIQIAIADSQSFWEIDEYGTEEMREDLKKALEDGLYSNWAEVFRQRWPKEAEQIIKRCRSGWDGERKRPITETVRLIDKTTGEVVLDFKQLFSRMFTPGGYYNG